jgi:hypothetical protein
MRTVVFGSLRRCLQVTSESRVTNEALWEGVTFNSSVIRNVENM